jgi:hypothetical protein
MRAVEGKPALISAMMRGIRPNTAMQIKTALAGFLRTTYALACVAKPEGAP